MSITIPQMSRHPTGRSRSVATCDRTQDTYVVFNDNVYVQNAYVILPYVNRTLTSSYDENKLRASYLQPKFTKSALNVSLILVKQAQTKKRLVED